MNKLYEKITFVNDSVPALNETNLNAISEAISNIDDRVCNLGDGIAEYLPKAEAITNSYNQILNDVTTTTANATSTNADKIASAESARQAKISEENAQAIVGIGVATTETAGIVKPNGSEILVDEDGTLNLGQASESIRGGVILGNTVNTNINGRINVNTQQCYFENTSVAFNYTDLRNRKKSKTLTHKTIAPADSITPSFYNAESVANTVTSILKYNENIDRSFYLDTMLEQDKVLWGLLGNIELVDRFETGSTATADHTYVLEHGAMYLLMDTITTTSNKNFRNSHMICIASCWDGVTTTAQAVGSQYAIGQTSTVSGLALTRTWEKDENDKYHTKIGIAAANTFTVRATLFKIGGSEADF